MEEPEGDKLKPKETDSAIRANCLVGEPCPFLSINTVYFPQPTAGKQSKMLRCTEKQARTTHCRETKQPLESDSDDSEVGTLRHGL